MAETLSTLSLISFIIAGVAFTAAVFLWIFFKIPRVIGDLSGRSARRSVARVRASNEKSGGKSYRPSAVNAARVKLTGTMPQTQGGQPTEEIIPEDAGMPETGLLADNRADGTGTQETALLSGEGGTELLLDEAATAPLSEERPPARPPAAQRKTLRMLDDILLIHTDEVVE